MFAKPSMEHQWLDQLIGHWKLEHNCQMPDGNTITTVGMMNCRSLGGMWLICESNGESPDDGPWSTVMSLGFDPDKKQYVGTFLGSMMANLWPYHGVLDADGKRLPLYSFGPSFHGNGNANYRDTIEIVDADSWLFSSAIQTEDGTWHQFLSGKNTRV